MNPEVERKEARGKDPEGLMLSSAPICHAQNKKQSANSPESLSMDTALCMQLGQAG